MPQDHRLSRVLHALLHLDQMKRPATSEEMAHMLQTNGAVVRRMMAGLRDAGIVTSSKGHGGGWSLRQPLDRITLWDVYDALGAPPLFAMGADDQTTTCLLARSANAATLAALQAARTRFEQSLKTTTVAKIARDAARL